MCSIIFRLVIVCWEEWRLIKTFVFVEEYFADDVLTIQILGGVHGNIIRQCLILPGRRRVVDDVTRVDMFRFPGQGWLEMTDIGHLAAEVDGLVFVDCDGLSPGFLDTVHLATGWSGV